MIIDMTIPKVFAVSGGRYYKVIWPLHPLKLSFAPPKTVEHQMQGTQVMPLWQCVHFWGVKAAIVVCWPFIF